jgi:large subunit ribosomal protein L13
MVKMKTFTATPATIKREWCVVDATDKTLGRLASQLAHRLRGKHKPEFTPNMDTGDHMVVINAEKIKVTGNKLEDKIYYRHTGYIGNLKSINLGKLMDTHPERAIQTAVKGMMPKNPLGRAMFRKLHVYAGPEHPHEAQQPTQLEL